MASLSFWSSAPMRSPPRLSRLPIPLLPAQVRQSFIKIPSYFSSLFSPSLAYITFDNAIAPVSNTLGPEGGGIFVMLSNFNHERWVMCCSSARSQRAIVEECLKWVNQRKAFGKPLSSQAVIRSKLAAMISRVESAQNWLENVTWQMCNMVGFWRLLSSSEGKS